ncbi:hypothetical protein NDU88_003026 [Pleurodeles waltl]|uniref:Uncharacterized protein n=1 Tax=Pleurodeles waltl TaxID=8319 RepID=A0AAV7Q7U6_PLEWA|nr:hypothetical protein NDU88_003026 [Pleurodeles waltl]
MGRAGDPLEFGRAGGQSFRLQRSCRVGAQDEPGASAGPLAGSGPPHEERPDLLPARLYAAAGRLERGTQEKRARCDQCGGLIASETGRCSTAWTWDRLLAGHGCPTETWPSLRRPGSVREGVWMPARQRPLGRVVAGSRPMRGAAVRPVTGPALAGPASLAWLDGDGPQIGGQACNISGGSGGSGAAVQSTEGH